MTQVFAISLGGAVGALLRFWMSTWVYARLGNGFSYGTLVVNVLGSLIMGVLYVLLVERLSLGVFWRAVGLIGLVGAFTTFSTFSIETFNLIEGGQLIKAVMNIVLSVILCVMAAWIGVILGRQV